MRGADGRRQRRGVLAVHQGKRCLLRVSDKRKLLRPFKALEVAEPNGNEGCNLCHMYSSYRIPSPTYFCSPMHYKGSDCSSPEISLANLLPCTSDPVLRGGRGQSKTFNVSHGGRAVVLVDWFLNIFKHKHPLKSTERLATMVTRLMDYGAYLAEFVGYISAYRARQVFFSTLFSVSFYRETTLSYHN